MAAVLNKLKQLHLQKKLANVYLISPPCGASDQVLSMPQWGTKLAEHIYSWESGGQQLDSLGHTDLLFLRPAEDKINYVLQDFNDYFREINYRPGQWTFRYIIIEAADRIPPIIANKLLMSLEFSPSWCIHFLLCDSRRSLLPTIESRAINITLSSEDLKSTSTEESTVTLNLPKDLQELLKDVQKGAGAARRWESDLLNLILHHPRFDLGDNSLHLCKILARNVTSLTFNNPAYERIVPLWHLLLSLNNQI